MITYIWPPQSVAVSVPPIEFVKNSVATQVSLDTVTPANSNGLPTSILDTSGNKITPLTDTQLRASAVAISATALPLPTGAATEAKQDTGNSSLNSINGKLPATLGQKASASSLSTVLSTEQEAILSAIKTSVELIDDTVTTDAGAKATKFQAIGGNSGTQGNVWYVDNTGRGRVEVMSSALPTGAATEAKQDAEAILIGAVNETAPVSDTAASGLNGRLQRIAQRLTSLIAILPASLGQKLMAASLSVTVASDQSAIPVSGPLTDAQLRASAVPVSASSLPLPTGAATEAKQDAEAILIGAVNEVAPVSDTASSGLNGRLQRIAQRLTSLIALLPSSVGQKANAGSLSVALSTEHEALIGSLTETAPATDTASSGLNGRLQRIAQRITSLIALVPASLGQKTMANSFAVTLASDQSALSTTQTALTGSYQEDLTVTDGAVETLTAPAGAKWVLLQADDTNVGNMRIKIGAAATTTSGMQLQPGRDMKLDCGGNVSYTMETGGTGKLYAQFGA